MGKYIPVEPEKWAEMVKAMAEVTRLNAVIESHKDAGLRILAMLDEERRNTSHLKAEVERLRASSFVTAVPIEQYERLRKAGDAIAICLCGGTTEDYNKRCALNWLAAKEGKQS